MRSLAAVVLMFFLAGCATQATLDRNAQIISYLSAQCEAEGYTKNTSEWKGCVNSKIPRPAFTPYTMPRTVTCHQTGAWTQCN